MKKIFVEYNPHPDNKLVGDCVKRALTKASGKSYRDLSNELNRLKRSIGASAYNVKSVWDKYLRENLQATYESFPAVKGKPRMNVERFCKSHPKGTYVLNVARHMVCCQDGKFYDTWDCSEKCVYGAYYVPDPKDLEIAASSAPKMVPMPGIEKLAELKDEYRPKSLSGNKIIEEFADTLDIKIKKSKGTLWIPLDREQHEYVLAHLLHNDKYKHLRWDTPIGGKKTKIRDDVSGMELIFKSDYLWCTKDRD